MRLYNPSIQDFSYTHFDDENKGKEYTLRAMEITTLPDHIGKFMLKHLIDWLIVENGVKTNWDDDRPMWKEKILV